MVLEFLLRHHERTGDPTSLAMAEQTLEAMARSGMYDQLGGGFARYAVDRALGRAALREDALRQRPAAARLPALVAAHRLAAGRAHRARDRRLPAARPPHAGGCVRVRAGRRHRRRRRPDLRAGRASSFARCSPTTRTAAAELFEVTLEGTFEHGASTLQLPRDPDDPQQYQDIRTRLFAARSLRPQPARDDKVVTAWNGLAIAALAEAGVLLDPRYLDAARECAELVLRPARRRRSAAPHVAGRRGGHRGRGGRGPRRPRRRPARAAPGHGRPALACRRRATCSTRRWRVSPTAAGDSSTPLTMPSSSSAGPKDPTDGATPSGASALANALLTYSALTGSLEHRAHADAALRIVTALGHPPTALPRAGRSRPPRARSPDPSRSPSSARAGRGELTADRVARPPARRRRRVRRAGRRRRAAARGPPAGRRASRPPMCATGWSATCR